MKIAIIYESKTGNTKLIAETIKKACEKDNIIIFKSVKDVLENGIKEEEIDLYFLGSWTDKGDCGDSMKEFSKTLNKEKVALFGTAGFGGSEEYYKSLADRFANRLSKDNEVLGYFYCQGKMPMSIRTRYVSMLTTNPEDEKLKVSIENFDAAQSHPNTNDLNNAKTFTKEILKK